MTEMDRTCIFPDEFIMSVKFESNDIYNRRTRIIVKSIHSSLRSTVGVLTTNSREKGQKHVNKTSAEVAEVVACREKSSEQQLFLPFSALYRNVCIKTLSSLSTTTKCFGFGITIRLIYYCTDMRQNTEDDRRSSSYAIGGTTCDKCTLGYFIMSINLKDIRKKFGVSKKSETPIKVKD
ncbi:hypothetical protein AGLY_007656 [Aphis glycines]|uniref:Uncharacterized protein n=1 Tax=Aphis glycines TaxID=307491 RepID=A0A6G0TMM2_APHGL|nr:hypothetical protein AGLY_007656 [Aphis glycines]